MPTYLHPGVYVEEIPSGSKPIEGVGTSTAAFIGYTTKGPLAEPTLISRWDEYEALFGGVRNLGQEADPMGLSVAAFFQNGGTKAYVIRVTQDLANKVNGSRRASKAVAYVDDPTCLGKKALKFTAVNEGAWANGLAIRLLPGQIPGTYDVEIGPESTDSAGNTSFSVSERFKGASLDADSPVHVAHVIKDASSLVTVESIQDISAVIGMFSDQYVGFSRGGDLSTASLNLSSLTPANRKLRLTIDTEPEKEIILAQHDFDLAALAAHIQDKVRDLEPPKACYTQFTCVVDRGHLVLTSGTRQPTSAVKVRSDYGVAPKLKLGVDAYNGTSTSAALPAAAPLFPIDLATTSKFPDAESRSLRGWIDGETFSFDLGTSALATIAALAARLNTIPGLTCAPDGNKLVLTSASHKATSSVKILSNYGIAPLLALGTDPINNGGEELTGQQAHEKGMSVGFSVGGELVLADVFPIAVNNATLFPTPESKQLIVRIDSGSPTTLSLPSTEAIASIGDLVTKLNGLLTGAVCAADGNRLTITSATHGPGSAVVVTPNFGLAARLRLGINNGGEEINGALACARNARTEMGGQESAEASFPKDRLDGGSDGDLPGEADYEQVFGALVKYRDINIVCVPGHYWTEDSSGDPIVQMAVAHAARMRNRLVIIDPPPSHELKNEKMVNDMGLPAQTYCVTYYPWVKTANRFYHPERAPGLPKNLLVPPSGYAAGMWAKIDAKRGVWKAPAGMETGLLGLSGLEFQVEDEEQDSLNPWGINCLRRMPGAGPVIWGSRTLATKADPEWRYVPVRRTAIMIEQSIYEGIQWAVFEPNDHRLWSALRGNIDGFMNGLFRAGAFQGEKASDAYFVRCGLGDTMTQGDIDAGQVIVIVGFAPLKPAEFVIVRIQQKVNQQ